MATMQLLLLEEDPGYIRAIFHTRVGIREEHSQCMARFDIFQWIKMQIVRPFF